MRGKDVYSIWAPYDKKWIGWVKPVPFIEIDKEKERKEIIDYYIPEINYITDVKQNTAIIVDIEGEESVKEGVALAKLGYRPIPVFNGTNPLPDCMAVTNNDIVEPLLVWGAMELKNVVIDDDAPPAFLLDKNRLHRHKFDRSVFDNSWDVYSQDIPSPKFFLDNGITQIIVRGEKINIDLRRVLYEHQKKKIKILFTNGYEEAKEIRIRKPKKSKE